MKKLVGLLMGLVLLIGGVYAQTIYTPDSTNIDLLVENVIPSMIQAGDDITLVVRVVNNGDSEGKIVGLDVDLPEGLVFVSSDPSLDESYVLCGGCSKVYNIYLKANKNIFSADYPINLVVKEPSVSLEKEFVLKVRAKPILTVYSQPYFLYPNSLTEISLDVKNVGGGAANNVMLSLKSNTFSVAGTDTIYLGTIRAGEKKTVSLKLLTPETIEPGSYSIPIVINYEDDVHNLYKYDSSLGVKILSNATLEISSLSFNPSVIYTNEEANLILRVENTGEGKAQEIKVRVEGDIGLLYEETYIGSLDEDEDSSVVFTFVPHEAGTHNIKIMVSYKDDTGSKVLTENYSLNVIKRKKDYAKYVILTVAILVGVVYFFIKNKKKR